MYAQSSTLNTKTTSSSQGAGILTEELVLNKYLPCIPDSDQSQINEAINKSQLQYLYQFQQQSQQIQIKKSSEQLDDEFDKSEKLDQPHFTYNTPQLTKLVIEKIVSSLSGPNDNHDVQLHILHMRQLAQEQEKAIQRAMIEGEKSKFNRKACEFGSVVREGPYKYCAQYYQSQVKLQQQFINDASTNFKTEQCEELSNSFNNYCQYSRSNSDPSNGQFEQRFQNEHNNILQSRSSNISYSAANILYHPKSSSNQNQNGQGNNSSFTKQNSHHHLQSSQATHQQQHQNVQQLNQQQQNSQQQNIQNAQCIQSQQQNQTLLNSSNQQLSSSHKNKKENKIGNSSAGKENSGSSVSIINNKISKENRTKKRAQTHLRMVSSQAAQNSINNGSSPINANHTLPQLTHQQQSAPAGINSNQSTNIQQTSINQNYPIQQHQSFYGNSFGYRTMYPQIYYNQVPYANQNQIGMGGLNNTSIYNNPSCNGYYYPQQSTVRNTNYSSQQNFQNNNNGGSSNNQALFTKQEGFNNEESADIVSQIESPISEMNNNNNVHNNHFNQSTYEDFFRNQDQEQQIPHISQQNSLQQPNSEDGLDNAEDDDDININYLND